MKPLYLWAASACCAVLVTTAPAAAAPLRSHQVRAANERAMFAYIAAIRYFNPGIDGGEAQRIVVAIVRESSLEGVDPRLVVAVVATESNFDRTARSPAGAMGLGQLMPQTAASDGVQNAADIDQNIHGTVLTLLGNLQHYAYLGKQQRYVFAIAAYNAGTGAVDRYQGVPPYDETIDYVWKVVVLWRRLSGMPAG